MNSKQSTGRWPLADDQLLAEVQSEQRDIEADVTFMRVTTGQLELAASDLRLKQRLMDELEDHLNEALTEIDRLKTREARLLRQEKDCAELQAVVQR